MTLHELGQFLLDVPTDRANLFVKHAGLRFAPGEHGMCVVIELDCGFHPQMEAVAKMLRDRLNAEKLAEQPAKAAKGGSK